LGSRQSVRISRASTRRCSGQLVWAYTCRRTAAGQQLQWRRRYV
jgi:hypothetical protein